MQSGLDLGLEGDRVKVYEHCDTVSFGAAGSKHFVYMVQT